MAVYNEVSKRKMRKQVVLARGLYNAKHSYWKSSLINPKGRQSYNTDMCSQNRFDFIFSGPSIYWPTDLKKFSGLTDFEVINIVDKNLVFAETCTDLCTEQSSVIITLNEEQNESQ